jgi:SIT4-associating protein SAP185/190
MGHLTLVAEEVVKFGERHPRELLSPTVQDYIYSHGWEEYVTKTLAETRERDNAILGGFRPDNGLGPRQAVLNAVNSGQGFGGGTGLTGVGLGGGQHALDSIDLSNNGSATSAGYNSSGSLSSGFGSSSDDDDEDMDDAEDEEHTRTATQLSAADTGLAMENVSGTRTG